MPYPTLLDTPTLSRIIALMLGRLQMSVTEAIGCYGTLAERVFSSTKLIRGEGKFRASKLEEVVKEIVAEKLGDPDACMLETRPEGDACKTYVVLDCLSRCNIDLPSGSCAPCLRW